MCHACAVSLNSSTSPCSTAYSVLILNSCGYETHLVILSKTLPSLLPEHFEGFYFASKWTVIGYKALYLSAEQLPHPWHMYPATASLGGFAMANWQMALTWPVSPMLGHTHCLLTEWGTRVLSAPLHPSNPVAPLCGHMFPMQGRISWTRTTVTFLNVRSHFVSRHLKTNHLTVSP